MQNFVKFFQWMAVVSLFFACSESGNFYDNEMPDPITENGDENARRMGHDEPVMVTVPFKANFIGDYAGFLIGPDAECGAPFNCRVFVDFEGNGTHLGNFTGSFEFCACGPEGEYGPTISSMIAANGDILYVSCEGRVIPGREEDHPDHVTSYWRDPFVILGGTGRFEGATGGGMTDDYNSSEDPNSHHHWTGSITMVKGKR